MTIAHLTMRHGALGLTLAAFSSALVACSVQYEPSTESEANSKTAPLQSIGALWDFARTDHFGTTWPANTIPVCFETGSYGSTDASAVPNFATFRLWFRDAIEDSFARVADLRFVDYGSCRSKEHAEMFGWIAIHWNSTPFSNVGYSTTTWTRMGLGLPVNTSEASKIEFQSSVRHEMAHALGFGHEYERTDNFTTCKDTTPENGTHWTDEYDPNSITNWSHCTGPTGQLSPGDIYGLQRAYGRKKSGSIVGLGGRCINTPGFNYTDGVGVVAYDCYGQTNDTWISTIKNQFQVFVQNTPSYELFALFNRLPRQSWGSVAEVRTFDGTGTSANTWKLENVEWRAIGNMCVAVRNPDAGDNRLIIVPCTGDAKQRWDWDYGGINGRVHNRYTGTCANVAYGNTTNGTSINTYPCGSPNPYPNEIFTTTDRGEMKYGGKCLNVADYFPSSGSELQLYECRPVNTPRTDLWYNELFHLTGEIKNSAESDALTLVEPSRNGAAIETRPSMGDRNQIWDIYF